MNFKILTLLLTFVAPKTTTTKMFGRGYRGRKTVSIGGNCAGLIGSTGSQNLAVRGYIKRSRGRIAAVGNPLIIPAKGNFDQRGTSYLRQCPRSDIPEENGSKYFQYTGDFSGVDFAELRIADPCHQDDYPCLYNLTVKINGQKVYYNPDTVCIGVKEDWDNIKTDNFIAGLNIYFNATNIRDSHVEEDPTPSNCEICIYTKFLRNCTYYFGA